MWLTEEERAYVRARLQADVGHSAAERKITVRDVLKVMSDYKIYLGGFMYFGLIIPAYGYAYFAPTIISTYNYSPIMTQLYSVPPWAVSFAFSLILAVFSDLTRHRALFATVPLCLSLAGLGILLGVHDNTHLQYGGLFLVVMGTYATMPIIVCWFTMNLGGHHRRAIGTAWQVGFGNIGGIVATYSFLATDAPYYTKGYAICCAFTAFSALMCVAYLVSIAVDNRRRARGARDAAAPTEQERKELGDKNPDFRCVSLAVRDGPAPEGSPPRARSR